MESENSQKESKGKTKHNILLIEKESQTNKSIESRFPERNLLKQKILFGKFENISRVFGVFEISTDRILIHSENQTPDSRETILIVLDIKRKKFEIVTKKKCTLKVIDGKPFKIEEPIDKIFQLKSGNFLLYKRNSIYLDILSKKNMKEIDRIELKYCPVDEFFELKKGKILVRTENNIHIYNHQHKLNYSYVLENCFDFKKIDRKELIFSKKCKKFRLYNLNLKQILILNDDIFFGICTDTVIKYSLISNKTIDFVDTQKYKDKNNLVSHQCLMSLDKKYLIMRVNCEDYTSLYDDDVDDDVNEDVDDYGLENENHYIDFIIINIDVMEIIKEITILYDHYYEELVFNCYLFPNNIFLLQLFETEDLVQDKYRHYSTIEVRLDISIKEENLSNEHKKDSENYKLPRLKIPIDDSFFCGSVLDIYFRDYISIPYVYVGYIPSGKLIICGKNNLEIYYFEK